LADVVAAMGDQRVIEQTQIEVSGAGAAFSTNARSFGIALLAAAKGRYQSFSPRVSPLVWPSLWPGAGSPADAAAMIILDDWNEISAEQQKSIDPFLSAFLEQTSARTFVGSRFLSLTQIPIPLYFRH
jgi:hypothetical protein